MEALHQFLQRTDFAGLALLLAVGFAVFILAAAWYTGWMLTHPPRRTYASAMARGRPGDPSELSTSRPFESWTFTSRGAEFPVWEIRGDLPPGQGPTVILTHGWADGRVGGLIRIEALAPFASRLILWDMRGHGDGPGICRLGTREVDDLASLIEHVRDAEPAPQPAPLRHRPTGVGNRVDAESEGRLRPEGSDPHIPDAALTGTAPFSRTRCDATSPDAESSSADRFSSAHNIILYGWSLGAGVSIAAATRPELQPRITAVIAEAPYRLPWTPARNVLRVRALPYRLNLPIAFGALGALLGAGPRWRRFDRATHASRLACPLLVIHGQNDRICPIHDGRAIAAAAPSGQLAAITDAGHNDLWTDQLLASRCAAAIDQFLKSLTTEAQRTQRKPEEQSARFAGPESGPDSLAV